MPLWIAEILYDSAWIFGTFLCKFGTFTTMINFYGSTFFLVAISIDRYIAIVHPLKVFNRSVLNSLITRWFPLGSNWQISAVAKSLRENERSQNVADCFKTLARDFLIINLSFNIGQITRTLTIKKIKNQCHEYSKFHDFLTWTAEVIEFCEGSDSS